MILKNITSKIWNEHPSCGTKVTTREHELKDNNKSLAEEEYDLHLLRPIINFNVKNCRFGVIQN